MSEARRDRAAVWAEFGAPSEQVGSVNDPRISEEHGLRWNEKWIYRSGAEIVRVVLWNRYDLVGVVELEAGSAAPPDAGSESA